MGSNAVERAVVLVKGGGAVEPCLTRKVKLLRSQVYDHRSSHEIQTQCLKYINVEVSEFVPKEHDGSGMELGADRSWQTTLARRSPIWRNST